MGWTLDWMALAPLKMGPRDDRPAKLPKVEPQGHLSIRKYIHHTPGGILCTWHVELWGGSRYLRVWIATKLCIFPTYTFVYLYHARQQLSIERVWKSQFGTPDNQPLRFDGKHKSFTIWKLWIWWLMAVHTIGKHRAQKQFHLWMQCLQKRSCSCHHFSCHWKDTLRIDVEPLCVHTAALAADELQTVLILDHGSVPTTESAKQTETKQRRANEIRFPKHSFNRNTGMAWHGLASGPGPAWNKPRNWLLELHG